MTTPNQYDRIAFVASPGPEAQQALLQRRRFGRQVSVEQCCDDAFVVQQPVEARGISTERLSQDQLVAVASPRHRLDLIGKPRFVTGMWCSASGVLLNASSMAPGSRRCWRRVSFKTLTSIMREEKSSSA